MPFRSSTTLNTWIREFLDSREGGALIRVIVQDSSDGADSGLVLVPLNNASTTVYLRPPANPDSRWRVVFEPQADEIAITAEETRALTAELNIAADLCSYLEARSWSHRETRPEA